MAYVPDEMVSASGAVSRTALRLALFYCKSADQKSGECWPSLIETAKAVGVRVDHARRYDDELIKKQWITIRPDKKKGRIVTMVKGWEGRAKRRAAHQNLGAVLPNETQNLGNINQNLGNINQNLVSHIRNHEPAHEPAHEPVLAAAAPRAKKAVAVNLQTTASQGVVFEAIAKLCQVDWRNCSARAAKQLGVAHERYRGMFPGKPDSALLAGLEAFEAWWFSQDWRGKRNQPPEPIQVVDLWPRFKRWFKSGKSDLGTNSANGRGRQKGLIIEGLGDE